MHNCTKSSSSDEYAYTVYIRTRESSCRLETVTVATKQELSDEEESASVFGLFFFTFLFPKSTVLKASHKLKPRIFNF